MTGGIQSDRLIEAARAQSQSESYERLRRRQAIAAILFTAMMLGGAYLAWTQIGVVYAVVLLLFLVHILWLGIRSYRLPRDDYLAGANRLKPGTALAGAVIAVFLAGVIAWALRFWFGHA